MYASVSSGAGSAPVWKDVARSFNDPVLRDFDWRTVHRVCINGIHEYPQHVHGVVKEWKH
jgi:hypothetical protein